MVEILGKKIGMYLKSQVNSLHLSVPRLRETRSVARWKLGFLSKTQHWGLDRPTFCPPLLFSTKPSFSFQSDAELVRGRVGKDLCRARYSWNLLNPETGKKLLICCLFSKQEASDVSPGRHSRITGSPWRTDSYSHIRTHREKEVVLYSCLRKGKEMIQRFLILCKYWLDLLNVISVPECITSLASHFFFISFITVFVWSQDQSFLKKFLSS